MADANSGIFQQLTKYSDVEELIESGEAESVHLECKAPSEPKLSQEQKGALATAISGFSNTAGGVLLYGVSTTKHTYTSLDVLTQIEPIGSIHKLEQQVKIAIPTATTPPILSTQTRVLRKKSGDTRGILVVQIPSTGGDPVQNARDNIFYFRTGDEFKPAPYEIIKRLFAAVDSPDLQIVFDEGIVTTAKDGTWIIPIVIANQSSAIAEHVVVSAQIVNPDACQQITTSNFSDESNINPGKKLFMTAVPTVIHKGLNRVVGDLKVNMKIASKPRRRLDLLITVYANKMRGRQLRCDLTLAKKGFAIKNAHYSDM